MTPGSSWNPRLHTPAATTPARPQYPTQPPQYPTQQQQPQYAPPPGLRGLGPTTTAHAAHHASNPYGASHAPPTAPLAAPSNTHHPGPFQERPFAGAVVVPRGYPHTTPAHYDEVGQLGQQFQQMRPPVYEYANATEHASVGTPAPPPHHIYEEVAARYERVEHLPAHAHAHAHALTRTPTAAPAPQAAANKDKSDYLNRVQRLVDEAQTLRGIALVVKASEKYAQAANILLDMLEATQTPMGEQRRMITKTSRQYLELARQLRSGRG